MKQSEITAGLVFGGGEGGGSGSGDVTGVKGSAESSYRQGNVNLSASNVGAYTKSEVDTALANKVDKSGSKVLSDNNYSDADKAIVDGVTDALADKVDKVSGKGLSKNDYTDADKAKVDALGTASTKDSTTTIASGNNDLPTSDAVNDAIEAAVTSAYKAGGAKACADLTNALLVAANEGMVYNMTDTGTTTADFIEGAGKEIGVGSDVAVIKVGSGYKFNLMPGLMDLSGYVQKSNTAGLLKNDGTVDTTTLGAVSDNTSAINGIKDGTDIDSFGDVETALAGKADAAGVAHLYGTDGEIPANADLNDYTTAGNYYCATAVNSTTLSNAPDGINCAFMMEVTKIIATSNAKRQIIKVANVSGKNIIYVRTYTTHNGGTWSAWSQLAVSENINAQQSLLKDTVGWTGKNLNKRPYTYNDVRTHNGVTYTVNADGSVTANGTASDGDANLPCHSRYGVSSNVNPLILPNGKYIISGCPAGGGDNTYSIIANCTNNGSAKTLGKTIGGDAEIALEGDDTSNDSVWLGYTIVIKEGQTVSDLTFYPMIRRADILDSTYEPYHESIQNQINDKGVLGAKNLLQITAQSQTYGGIQYVVSNDGTITAKSGGTCSQNGQLEINTAMTFKAGVKYILSGCCPNPPEENKDDFWLGVYNTSPANYDFMVEAGQETLVSYDTDTTRVIKIRMLQGVELTSDLVYKPMIRLASDPDNTYQPYAMTNRELTEYEWQTVASVQGSSSTTNEDLFGTFAPYIDNANYEYRMLMYVSGVPCNIYSESRYYSNLIHFYSVMGNIGGYVEYSTAITINTSTSKATHVEVKIASDGTVTVGDKTSEGTSSSNKYYLQRRKRVAI